MKVHVEPKPLHEPLAGGTPGATVDGRTARRRPRHLAAHDDGTPGGRFETLKLLRALLSGKPAATVPVPRLPDPPPERRRDPGRHRPAPLDRHRRQGELRRASAPASASRRWRPAKTCRAQLRERGLDPGEIPIVVMTHMHIDHTSAISEFPNSTFVVSEAEWEAAATGSRPLLNGYRRAHFDYAFDYRTVDFDRGGIDSYASFGRTFDLFGDGSIRLAFTPGHSAGHMSVICRLERARLRDRRRRHLHRRPSSTATRRCRRAPSTPTTTAARCRSCGSSAASTPTRSSRRATTRSSTPGSSARYE